jgi:hypothetical protein
MGGGGNHRDVLLKVEPKFCELAEPRRVVVHQCVRVAKRFKQRVEADDPVFETV